MINKYLSPYIKLTTTYVWVPAYARYNLILGKNLTFSVWRNYDQKTWQRFGGSEEKYNSKEDAQKALDKYLTVNGYILLDQETFDKLNILI